MWKATAAVSGIQPVCDGVLRTRNLCRYPQELRHLRLGFSPRQTCGWPQASDRVLVTYEVTK